MIRGARPGAVGLREGAEYIVGPVVRSTVEMQQKRKFWEGEEETVAGPAVRR